MTVIVGLDLETNSLNKDTGEVVELGYAVYDVDTHNVLYVCDDFMQGTGVSEETTRITGITQEQVDCYGVIPGNAYARFLATVFKSQAIALVAHNGLTFDYPFLNSHMKRVSGNVMSLPNVHLVDTRTDIAYPKNVIGRSQKAIQDAMGIVNPYQHRAIFDVLSMLDILAHFDFKDVLNVAKTSPITYITPVGRVDNATLKANGFYFKDGVKWGKAIREALFAHEKAVLPFDIDLW